MKRKSKRQRKTVSQNHLDLKKEKKLNLKRKKII